jgi:hypothetical protein
MNPIPSRWITEQYYIHIISSGSKDPDEFHCYRYGDSEKDLSVDVFLDGTKQIWQFTGRQYDVDTAYDSSDSEGDL